MTDVGDEQDRAEVLDADKLAEDLDDPTGELDYPPDRPLGVNQYGTTQAEEHVGEPIEEGIRRDTPDPLDAIDEPNDAELLAIEEEADDLLELDGNAVDESGNAIDDETALDDLDGSKPVGRLVDPNAEDDGQDLLDDEPDAVARSADETEHDLSAEEAAVHLTSDPPLGALGDGYVRPEDD